MEIEYVFLNDAVDIITGVMEKSEDEGSFQYFYYQPTNFGEYGLTEKPQRILKNDPLLGKQMLKINDVLIKRLNPNYPLLISELPGDSFFSTNLFALRCKKNIVPEYIAFLFEQPQILKQISDVSGISSVIQAVSVSKLKEIKIPLLTFEKQEIVGKWWELAKKRKKLLMNYITETDKLYRAISDKILKEKK